MNPVARLSLVDRTDDDLSVVAQWPAAEGGPPRHCIGVPAAVSEDDLRLMRADR